jgi:hypothetical protein
VSIHIRIQLFACTSIIIILPWTIDSHMNNVEFIWSWLRRTIDWSHRYILKQKENTGENKKRNNQTTAESGFY